jgi:tetratricopeptide (TPR) repeat protein
MRNDLLSALQYHQAGHLDEARRIYQDLLRADRDSADAWHLLGVLAHQQRQHDRAAEMIGRAVALNPGASLYHANLAEVYRALGRLDRAEDCCRTALCLQPDYPEAANSLGLILLARGQTGEAVAQFRLAFRLRPGFAMACNNLGNALRCQGDTTGALAHFRLALEREPTLAEAHSNLGQMLLERKDLEEALPHCRHAVRLRPNLAEAHNNLGNVLRELGRLEDARSAYAEALRLNPDLAMVYNNMAQAFQEECRIDEAMTWYGRAIELEPNTARYHGNLASAMEEQEKHDEAVARYEIALQLDPGHAESCNGLGRIRHEQGRYDDALAHYRQALRLDPSLAVAHCNLGTLQEELSDFDGAEQSFREALGHDPRQAGAYAQLATMRRGRLSEADLAAMRSLLAGPYLTGGKRSALHFGLAQVLDARACYVEAAEHLGEANALALAEWSKRGHGYDPADHSRFVAGMIAACTPAFFDRVRGWGLETERPIFIFGLPRSGTTLTEQILAGHSQVFGAGELRLGHEDLEALSAGSQAGPQEGLARLDADMARRIAQRHLDRLGELNASFPRVADKMPDNYLCLGLLVALFPKARFIHCHRDLRDVAVSCWMTHFRQIRWANDPEHIASRFHEYERLLAHWRRTLPVPMLEVAYEETVADLDGVARRLVAWCGLQWEPACLEFHRVRRPVRTASVTQVRQPIYARSVGRWRHYDQTLTTLLAQLDDGYGSGRRGKQA